MAIVKGFTPDHRGPLLRDGTGGTSERPAARQRDPVLENVGWQTKDIRLTAGGTDQSAGNSAFYNFGQVDQASVGRYLFKAQSAASATADPLGASEYITLEIRETTAGVFEIFNVTDLDNTPAAGLWTNMAAAVYLTDDDAVTFATTNGDSDVVFHVCDATSAANLNTNNSTDTFSVGDLVIVEPRSTTTEVWSCTRLS